MKEKYIMLRFSYFTTVRLLVVNIFLSGCSLDYPFYEASARMTPTSYYKIDVKVRVDKEVISFSDTWLCDKRVDVSPVKYRPYFEWNKSKYTVMTRIGPNSAIAISTLECESDIPVNYRPYLYWIDDIDNINDESCYERYDSGIEVSSDSSLRVELLTATINKISKSEHDLGKNEEYVPVLNEFGFGYNTLSAFVFSESVWRNNEELAVLLKEPKWLKFETNSRFSTMRLKTFWDYDLNAVLLFIRNAPEKYGVKNVPLIQKNGVWEIVPEKWGMTYWCKGQGRGPWRVKYSTGEFDYLTYRESVYYDPGDNTVVFLRSRRWNSNKLLEPRETKKVPSEKNGYLGSE